MIAVALVKKVEDDGEVEVVKLTLNYQPIVQPYAPVIARSPKRSIDISALGDTTVEDTLFTTRTKRSADRSSARLTMLHILLQPE